MFTTIVCGGLTEPVLGWSGMKMQAGYKTLNQGDKHGGDDTEEGSVRAKISNFRKWWMNVEKTVMRPTFTREHGAGGGHGAHAQHGKKLDTVSRDVAESMDDSTPSGLEGLELSPRAADSDSGHVMKPLI